MDPRRLSAESEIREAVDGVMTGAHFFLELKICVVLKGMGWSKSNRSENCD
jgi:hypothetical protein